MTAMAAATAAARVLADGWYVRWGWDTAHYLHEGFSLCGILIRDRVQGADAERHCRRCVKSLEVGSDRAKRWSW